MEKSTQTIGEPPCCFCLSSTRLQTQLGVMPVSTAIHFKQPQQGGSYFSDDTIGLKSLLWSAYIHLYSKVQPLLNPFETPHLCLYKLSLSSSTCTLPVQHFSCPLLWSLLQNLSCHLCLLQKNSRTLNTSHGWLDHRYVHWEMSDPLHPISSFWGSIVPGCYGSFLFKASPQRSNRPKSASTVHASLPVFWFVNKSFKHILSMLWSTLTELTVTIMERLQHAQDYTLQRDILHSYLVSIS